MNHLLCVKQTVCFRAEVADFNVQPFDIFGKGSNGCGIEVFASLLLKYLNIALVMCIVCFSSDKCFIASLKKLPIQDTSIDWFLQQNTQL